MFTGFYNPQKDGIRLPVSDQDGAALPDQLAPLTEVEILP